MRRGPTGMDRPAGAEAWPEAGTLGRHTPKMRQAHHWPCAGVTGSRGRKWGWCLAVSTSDQAQHNAGRSKAQREPCLVISLPPASGRSLGFSQVQRRLRGSLSAGRGSGARVTGHSGDPVHGPGGSSGHSPRGETPAASGSLEPPGDHWGLYSHGYSQGSQSPRQV